MHSHEKTFITVPHIKGSDVNTPSWYLCQSTTSTLVECHFSCYHWLT